MKDGPAVRLLEPAVVGVRIASGQVVADPRLVHALLGAGTRVEFVESSPQHDGDAESPRAQPAAGR